METLENANGMFCNVVSINDHIVHKGKPREFGSRDLLALKLVAKCQSNPLAKE